MYEVSEEINRIAHISPLPIHLRGGAIKNKIIKNCRFARKFTFLTFFLFPVIPNDYTKGSSY
jgi:hypothetical protein